MALRKFKVVSNYPNTKFEIGDILVQYYFETDPTNYVYTTNPEIPLQGSNMNKENVESMPHIFQEIF